MYRLKFEKMIENTIEVLRLCCFGVCAPTTLIECVLTLAFYTKISLCPKAEGFTHVLAFIMIIAGCLGLALTAYCCYHMFMVGKIVRDVWPEIRHNIQYEDDLEAQDSENSSQNSNRNSDYQPVRDQSVMYGSDHRPIRS
jgi:hypothetical protein